MKPLGRDRLGRLIYEGDYVWPHKPDDPYWIPVWREKDGRVAFDEGFGLAEHTTWPEFVTIDLDASPKRTNYERYFADLGSLDEIKEAFDDIEPCDPGACFSCPFRKWGQAFCMGGTGSCLGFKAWLNQEATL